ncbi:AAA family ATPase [Alsobacter sp. SYSU M60028]|uniref:AAA family ATPase n=1 Tax=Alsobacter ponti TaxID=2962936 RepID=A0ABT1LD29_9HYPH|nr:AAA family ATPase [Alsobacter ponti]MCP8939397.1 AAA family ATPase [Alsobacter ponti]
MAEIIRDFPPDRRRLSAFNADAFAGQPVPHRDWFVEGQIPLRTVTQLSADGGTGKSLIANQVAVAAVTATDSPIGIPRPGGVIYLSAEDDRDEIHRRLDAITRARGLALDDLSALRIVPLAGEDAVLAGLRPGSQSIVATPLWQALREEVLDLRPILVVLDTQADVFAGNENDRSQVRQFVGMLRGLAIEADLAVLLLAHPSLTGMSSGSGLSGSTAWNNSVRSRLYLERVKDESGVERDTDVRVLRTMKSNYSAKGAEIRLRYQDGRFVPDLGGGTAYGAAEADQVFLDLLAQFERQGRTVSPNSGANYAPNEFAKHPDALSISKVSFRAAMDRLLASGRVVIEDIGPPSRRLKALKRRDAE